MSTVLVFKTSVANLRDIHILKPVLDRLISENGYWNFDLEDCDNILRVEAQKVKPDNILQELTQHGFSCEELV